MAADHVVAVVDRYRRGRSDRQMASEAGIPLHWLQYPLKPSTRIKIMPEEQRLRALARATGAPVEELRAAYTKDVRHVEPDPELVPDRDPLTVQAHRLFAGLDVPYRVTAVSMLKSLATLQRKDTTIDSDVREVG